MSAIQIYVLRRLAQSSVGTRIETQMSRPPMVGVPALERCDSGPVFTNRLTDLELPQAPNQPRPQQNPQAEGRKARQRRAGRDVTEDTKTG